MSQIILRDISIGYGGLPLIENGNLTIERGEKVCLIGRNGAGKSTLLKLIYGALVPDRGSIEKDGGLTLAFLSQEIPDSLNQTVFEVVLEGLQDRDLEEWDQQYRVEKVISKLQLIGDQQFDSLSGGLKRRVLLAKALVIDPDVLILDEPTNHLDIEAITWLEKFLRGYHKTVIFVTHDRMLMQSISTDIVEVDNGTLHSWKGRYQDYLKHKELLLESEEKEHKLFDKKLASEEVWIRQGIKARRTRNEGRVRALEKMREQRSDRRIRTGNVSLKQHDLDRSGKIVFDVENVSYSYDDNPIIKDFSSVILRGDKVGLIGPNGSGKSTLLNLLLGKLEPDSGNIKRGTKLEVAYFDQRQVELDGEKSVQDNVSGGSTSVTVAGKEKHIMSYLQDFLFSPERARSQVKVLSGGERNRVMLAKLFLKPCNLLVLDEPTNDLDVETLEMLEEQLVNYQGTLLLVSHDREFLNNIVTSTLVMEGDGKVGEYVGGYDDWLRQRKIVDLENKTERGEKTKSEKVSTEKNKLSYKEKRELDMIAKKITQLESSQTELQQQLADPEFYKKHPDKVSEIQKTLTQIECDLEMSLARWEELEQLNS